MKMDRREFLKLSGMSLLAMQFSPDVFASESYITHAGHFGAFKAKLKDGKLVSAESFPHDKNPNIALKYMADRLYAPNRVQYPFVRKSYLESLGKPELRGKEPFVRVSWRQALDLVADSLNRIKNEFGNESIFRTANSTWAQAGLINRPASWQGRFLNYFGGFSDTIGDYSTSAAQHILPHILGSMDVYSRQTSREVIEKNTEVMILWGVDPLKTNRIDSKIPDHDMDEWFYRFKRSGMDIICIDPIKSETAEKIAGEWIPIVPNSDVAMILAMCHVLLKEKLYDRGFINRYTVGFSHFEKYLLGADDGVVKTPEWAEKICSVSADKIKYLARIAANKRSLLSASWACQRSHHGEQLHWSLVALASMIGQIGLPGGGFSFNLHYGGGSSPGSGVRMPVGVSQGRNPVNTYIPTSRLGDMLLNPGKTIDFNGRKITYPNVRLVYTAGVTPIGHQPDVNEVIKGFRKMDTIITHEPWWTPTARMSDIVLPATTTMERNDISFGGTHSRNRIWAMKQLVQPLFEAKDDFWIFSQLAKRFGFEKKFTADRSLMEWIEWSYGRSGSEVSFNDFWSDGVVEFDIPKENEGFVRYADFRKDPEKHNLRTPSGRIEIYSEKVASFGYDDCQGHPKWLPPAEWLGARGTSKYPYHMLSPHPRYRLHSQMDNTELRHKYKINGREPMHMSKSDAKKLNLKTGDTAEVYNSRGAIVVGVLVSDKIKEGVVSVDEGAWYYSEDGSRCLSGQANVLTSSRPSSKLAQGTSSGSCIVAIRKIENTPENRAYETPETL